jgi:hypothetical protein
MKLENGKIMKILKKALVASAILSAFASQAATVSSTPLKLSAEGVAAKVTPAASKLTFDIVVDELHPSAATITLSFDGNVDLNNLACSNTVIQGVGNGTAYCGDVGFDYGTGSFTFDNVVITPGTSTTNDTLSFQVNLGNPLTSKSGFRVVLGNHGYGGTATDRVLVKGESTLSYRSVDASSVEIETGTGVIATEVTQFGFAVKTDLDGIVERAAQKTFVGSTTTNDKVVYTLSNDVTLGLSLLNADIDVTLEGKFAGISAFTGVTVDTLGTVATQSITGTSGKETATVSDFSTTAFSSSVKSHTATVTFDNAGAKLIPITGDVVAKAIVKSATATSFPTAGITIASKVDAGEWELDATVINVPYFPVLYTGTSASVHFANESSKVADVMVTAIDNNGTEYGPLDLGMDLAANTVTKVKQTDIATLFNIDSNTKLSVTFNIDADNGDVNAYATIANEDGRSEVSTSQQRK